MIRRLGRGEILEVIPVSSGRFFPRRQADRLRRDGWGNAVVASLAETAGVIASTPQKPPEIICG